MRGLYADGIASCEHALTREPGNLLTVFNLALAHEHLGRYGEALTWVARGLEIDPRDTSLQKLEFRLRALRVVAPVRRLLGKLAVWKR